MNQYFKKNIDTAGINKASNIDSKINLVLKWFNFCGNIVHVYLYVLNGIKDVCKTLISK